MTIGRNGTHRERLLYVFVSFCFVMYVYGRYVKIMLPLLDFDGNGALGNKFPPHTSQHPKKWWFFIVVYGVPALRACFWRIFRNFLRENLSECQVAKSKFGPRRSLEVAQAPPIRSNQTHISYRRASVEHRAFASVLGLWGFLSTPSDYYARSCCCSYCCFAQTHASAPWTLSYTDET